MAPTKLLHLADLVLVQFRVGHAEELTAIAVRQQQQGQRESVYQLSIYPTHLMM